MLRSVPALFLVSASLAALPIPDRPLATLRHSHPRLIATGAGFVRLKSLVASDPFAAKLYAGLRKQADGMLDEPAVVHRLIGPRLLDQSRLCLVRVYTLALVYHLSGEGKYLDRAVKELRAAAAFADWNPSHFLDVAEMTHAFAIGYDWLYQDLTPDDRALFRRAIIEKGLDQAIPIYKERRWWAIASHNWNQVCNGGITLGALAIADEDPARAGYIVKQAAESIQLAMASYAPEGGWTEGPAYWHYATSYNVYFLAALETALGTDFGLSGMPGFSQAGDFRVYFQGPAGTFNYADAHPGAGTAPEMFWLARRFHQPVYAWDELRHLRANARPEALDLLWYQPESRSPSQAGWAPRRAFAGVNVAFLRGDWDDPNSMWVAVKGGDNAANHSHLDLGSFVLDAGGVRWGLDLGSDEYNMPGYFGAQRYTYYRLRTESHNTVLIDGENQDLKARAPLIMKVGAALVDLSRAYPGKVSRFTRTVDMDTHESVTIRDEVEAVHPVDVLWGMVTDARATIDGSRARLEKEGSSLWMEILSPRDAVFETVSTSQPPPQDPNTGTRKLVVRLNARMTRATIEVRIRRLPAVGY